MSADTDFGKRMHVAACNRSASLDSRQECGSDLIQIIPLKVKRNRKSGRLLQRTCQRVNARVATAQTFEQLLSAASDQRQVPSLLGISCEDILRTVTSPVDEVRTQAIYCFWGSFRSGLRAKSPLLCDKHMLFTTYL